MLEIHDLNVNIGPTAILRNIRLRVDHGAIVGLTGRNGAGKTTLMRTIMGLLKPKSGTMQFHGQDLVALHAHQRSALGFGYAPEDRRLIPDLNVLENLCTPAWALGMKPAQIEQRLHHVQRIIPELEEFRPRRAMQLSGGQQKLVAIGRALMTADKLLLLDEPFEGVAPALSKRIAEVVGELRKEGFSALLSGADLQHAANVLDHTYQIDRGQMVAAESTRT
ncbi:ATP-binding cassette domain-containing protein [Yanghanlia caeni]|uniref:ATP-binding cassette domain-containing protein n=1 Tax=Yanghanlia caeni TaxID=3064283 RepID=A0ABU1D264_9BURK|nr:ATP-binding cassette domain-containing protein [Alcaligenaceae bacterium LG-2]NGR06731.1 ATP-binding cassette domain-containing protein [bacterium SGD-2]HZH55573.1 ATP-binding cassette domain-containing protein [Burkholderiaceae bacterium]